MTVVVQRLRQELRPMILAHLLALPRQDRGFRFGTALPARAVAAYVERLDFGRDTLLGVQAHGLALVGVAHVAFEAAQAEVGVSVLPRYRRAGIGEALLRRAVEHARNRGAMVLAMQALSVNGPILRLVQRLGMRTVNRGVETHGQLELPEPSMTSMLKERLTDALAACDGALRAIVAGWNCGIGRRRPASEKS